MQQEIKYSQFRKLGFSEFYGVILSRALAEDMPVGRKFNGGAADVCRGRYANSKVVFKVTERDDSAHTITLTQDNGKVITCDYSSLLDGTARKPRTAKTTTTPKTENGNMDNNKTTTSAAAATGAATIDNNGMMAALNAYMAQQNAAAIEAARAETAAAYTAQIEELKRENEQLKATPSGTVINVTINGETTTTHTQKVLPECFGDCLELLKANFNLFLYGPAGSGKNVLAEELANCMGAKFFYFNTLVTKFDLTGYTDANGVYKTTPLYEAVKYAQSGGESVVLLDEICTGAPEALVCINAALANGYFTFADSGEQVSLERVHFIAADNTNGQGATDEYNGRYKMDESTRDRFFFQELTYQPQIEESICGEHKDILTFLRDVRRAAKENRISLVCGYRSMASFTQFAHWDAAKLVKGFLLKGMETDSARILYDALDDKKNRFAVALGKLVNA